MSFDSANCPIYISVRDRVTVLRELVSWLEDAGQQRIILLDNDSAYEPLLEYLKASPHEVVYLKENLGSRAIWKSGIDLSHGWWAYTDPDLLPIEDCPQDLIAHLHEIACRYSRRKAGVGLYLDDLPEDFYSMAWERELLSRPLEPGVFDSLVDTTLAVYMPDTPHSLRALRTGVPYAARHISWYSRPGSELSEEDQFYVSRARIGPLGSSWAGELAVIAQKLEDGN